MSRFGLIIALSAVAGAAYYGLWIVGDENKVLEKAAQVCASGKVRTVYSGLPKVDDTLCILNAFFEASASVGPQVQIYNALFLSLFAVPIVITYLEASRPSAPFLIKISPSITAFIAQLAAAGQTYPIWFALYLILGGKIGSAQGNQKRIRGLFSSLVLALFVPAVLSGDPFKVLTRDHKYQIGALFQFFPVTLAALQTILPFILPSSHKSAARSQSATLAIFGAFTAILYWVALFRIYKISEATSSSFLEVINSMIDFPLHPSSFGEVCHLFLIFDGLAVLVSSLLFILFAPGPKRGDMGIVLGVHLLTPLIGPAAALFWAWMRRTSEDGVEVSKNKKTA